ncbi:hypothetical protein L3Q82_007615 [Scortum barcoo]|uniref:Uncharacterized protein n=1 Tax=Scortum barcoo TaxID=214431 RepID=A0ACB8WNT2_9TELE|nr:hypothetical protein L3Q82_007615 [Scortum barcoo]
MGAPLLELQPVMVFICTVCSQPYQVGSDGSCLNSTTDYLLDGSDLCCKKCPPAGKGHRRKKECSATTETECEPCPKGQYIESWNYSPNCFSCIKCKDAKGLEYGQNCSSTSRSKCVCKPGMYCIIGFADPHCEECSKYTKCKAGYGVTVPGTANSNVRCEKCASGTFSDTVSYKDPCQPHTNCHGKVVRHGNASSNAVCEPVISTIHTETMLPTTSAMMSASSVRSDLSTPLGLIDSTPSTSHPPSVSETVFSHSTKILPQSPVSDSVLAVITAVGIGFMLLFIFIILLCLRKLISKKDPAMFHPKVDANGNCESGDKMNQDYLGGTQMTTTSFAVTSPEQQHLLEKGEHRSDLSLSNNNTETLTRTDGCSSFESIGSLQSTMACQGPHSALSEPMTLRSNVEPVTPQPGVPAQPSSQASSQPSSQASCLPSSLPSSQPTSPQIVSPVTTSPHVKVNITFHIGNGSVGSQAVLPADMMQVDSKLRFGEEEESFSIPQQEAGKQLLIDYKAGIPRFPKIFSVNSHMALSLSLED